MILRGIFHVVSRFLYISCYIAEIFITFLTVYYVGFGLQMSPISAHAFCSDLHECICPYAMLFQTYTMRVPPMSAQFCYAVMQLRTFLTCITMSAIADNVYICLLSIHVVYTVYCTIYSVHTCISRYEYYSVSAHPRFSFHIHNMSTDITFL